MEKEKSRLRTMNLQQVILSVVLNNRWNYILQNFQNI